MSFSKTMKDILNNITAAKLNTLNYGDSGRVRFKAGTPPVYRYPFFTKGGQNLASYHTNVRINKDANTLDLKISTTEGIVDYILNKLGVNYSVKKSFSLADDSASVNKQVVKFISSNDIHKFVQENGFLAKLKRIL